MDLIVSRNTGGVSGFKDEYESFVKRVKAQHLNTFNEFTGKADIGKLPDVPKYVIKPKDGADSIGPESCPRLFTKCKKYFTNSQKISVQVCVFLCTVY